MKATISLKSRKYKHKGAIEWFNAVLESEDDFIKMNNAVEKCIGKIEKAWEDAKDSSNIIIDKKNEEITSAKEFWDTKMEEKMETVAQLENTEEKIETSSDTINNKIIEVNNSIRKIVETLSKEIRNSYDYEKKLLAPINLNWNNIINSINPQYELDKVEEMKTFWNLLAEK